MTHAPPTLPTGGGGNQPRFPNSNFVSLLFNQYTTCHKKKMQVSAKGVAPHWTPSSCEFLFCVLTIDSWRISLGHKMCRDLRGSDL